MSRSIQTNCSGVKGGDCSSPASRGSDLSPARSVISVSSSVQPKEAMQQNSLATSKMAEGCREVQACGQWANAHAQLHDRPDIPTVFVNLV